MARNYFNRYIWLIAHSQVERWVARYKQFGPEGLLLKHGSIFIKKGSLYHKSQVTS